MVILLKLHNKDTIEYFSWFLYACTCIEYTFFFMLALEKHSWCCKIYSTISTSKWYRYSFRHWVVVLLINHWQFSLYRIELQSLDKNNPWLISITIVHHHSKNYNVLNNLADISLTVSDWLCIRLFCKLMTFEMLF